MSKTMTLADDVRDVLSRSTFGPDRVQLPNERLDPKFYKRVAAAIEAAGGKWNRKAAAHIFPAGIDAREALGGAAESGKVAKRQQSIQSFYTPEDVAEELVCFAGKEGVRWLEPSGGEGAIADMILFLTGRDPVIVESDPAAILVLKARGYQHVHGCDFLSLSDGDLGGKFDRIAMNPPFAKNQDIDHVRHAFSMLAPKGFLVSIVSHAAWFGTQKKQREFRAFAEEHGEYVKSLPSGTFKDTDVETHVIRLSR